MTDPGRFRPEIQGLRAVAAVMIATYHIWFNRVSGGVDVFFVVSGFLITGTVVRELDRTDRFAVGPYLTRIARRLFPAAWVVLVATAVGIVTVTSRIYWESYFADLRAAATYTANIRLAGTSVDYLAQDVPKSPVQHFWAMAIQGQFYLAWPIVIWIGWWLARRVGRPGVTGVKTVTAGVVVASFSFSVARTASDPAAMYFSTGARLWEFAVGGVLALAIERVHLGRRMGQLCATFGLGGVALTGVVTGGIAFPGWVAALPVLSAVALFLAGTSPTPGPAITLLRWRPLVAAGDYSYAFFLWHWPLLTLWLAADRSLSASAVEGVVILLASALLSWLSVRLVEAPAQRRRAGPRTLPIPREVVIAGSTLALLIGGTVLVERQTFASLRQSTATEGRGNDAPGEPDSSPAPKDTTLAVDSVFDPEMPIVPDPLVARDDLPLARRTGCVDPKKPPREIVPCVFGRRGGPVIAVVGGSHAIQWIDAVDAIGAAHGWEIHLIGQPGCRLGRNPGSTCNKWAARVRDYLASHPPLAVFTTGTVARKQSETVGAGYVDEWASLAEIGVAVIAVRDNPEFQIAGPVCIDTNRSDPRRCDVPRERVLAPVNPLERVASLPGNVTVLDLTSYWCTDISCLTMVDNVLVYRDQHHFTATFVRSLVPALESRMVPIVEALLG